MEFIHKNFTPIFTTIKHTLEMKKIAFLFAYTHIILFYAFTSL